MNSSQIPYASDRFKIDQELGSLIDRVLTQSRATWTDIHEGSGVYVVYHTEPSNMKFNSTATPSNCKVAPAETLAEKWNRITQNEPTDIVYIGKGNVRSRVKALIRFGLGKARNHGGGEWMWQINECRKLRLLVSACPLGKEMAYEKYLLDKFKLEHGDWPLANRKGGDGTEIWYSTFDGGNEGL